MFINDESSNVRAVGGGVESQEAVEHDLRDENALEEFLVEPEPAGDVGALEGSARGVLGVIGAVAAFLLRLLEPRCNFAKTASGIVGPRGLETRHEVVI